MITPHLGINSISQADPFNYIAWAAQVVGSDLVAHWPMDETSGTAIADVSGNALHGANNNATLGGALSIFGKPAPVFDASKDIDLFSAGLAAVWPKTDGFISLWAKAPTYSFWSDGQIRYVFLAQGPNTNDRVFLRKTATIWQLVQFYVANATIDDYNLYRNSTGWFHYLVSWSDNGDVVNWYFNGAKVGTHATVGTWTAALNVFRIGSGNGSNYWSLGSVSNVIVGKRPATDADAYRLATTHRRPIRISVIGDSNAATATNVKWPEHLNNVAPYRIAWYNHAVGGATILTNPSTHNDMETQITACANDNADMALFALGQNDNNAGDMEALKAIVRTAIDNYRASNPYAHILYIIPFDRWDEITGVPVDKDNIRAAIRTVCTEKAVPWKETHDWFLNEDLVDGTHGLDLMYLKVAYNLMQEIRP